MKTTKILSVIATMILVAGYASASDLSQDSAKIVAQAIVDNDLSKVKSLLENQKDISSQSDYFFENLNRPYKGMSICRSEIGEYLVQKGAKFTDFDGAKCLGLEKLTFPNLPKEKFIQIASDYSARIGQLPGNIRQNFCITQGCEAQMWADAIPLDSEINFGNALLPSLEKVCSSWKKPLSSMLSGQDSVSPCDLNQKIRPQLAELVKVKSESDAQMKKAAEKEIADKAANDKAIEEYFNNYREELKKQEAAEEKAANTPENLKSGACGFYSRVKMYEAILANEKKISDESGVTNLRTRHNATGMKQFMQNNTNQIKEKYRKETGKELDLSTCKND